MERDRGDRAERRKTKIPETRPPSPSSFQGLPVSLPPLCTDRQKLWAEVLRAPPTRHLRFLGGHRSPPAALAPELGVTTPGGLLPSRQFLSDHASSHFVSFSFSLKVFLFLPFFSPFPKSSFSVPPDDSQYVLTPLSFSVWEVSLSFEWLRYEVEI